jgi:3-deoxy-D-manno-octulosonic-acid transferase
MRSEPILHFAYTSLARLALPAILARLLYKSLRSPDYLHRIGERLGHTGFGDISAQGKSIWIHAVSVGEAHVAKPLVARLQERLPGRNLVVTATTPTGSRAVAGRFPAGIKHTYLPYDLPGAGRRFLNRTRPEIALFMETEIWPTLYRLCAERNIPVYLANARLSPRSFKGYSRIKSFIGPTLNSCRKILAQSSQDAERFLELGADPSKVFTTGNMKFDMSPDPEAVGLGRGLREEFGNRRPVWIAASTHQGEEELILQAHREIVRRLPEALLVLVPRHPERFDGVAELCRRSGFEFVRRSTGKRVTAATGIFLGDSMGELPMYYAACDVALVGGSLVPAGGHNPLEPASLGLPVLSGPHLVNFREIAGLLQQENGLRIVDDAGGLSSEVLSLLRNQAERKVMGNGAAKVLRANQGAVDKVLEHVLPSRSGS